MKERSYGGEKEVKSVHVHLPWPYPTSWDTPFPLLAPLPSLVVGAMQLLVLTSVPADPSLCLAPIPSSFLCYSQCGGVSKLFTHTESRMTDIITPSASSFPLSQRCWPSFNFKTGERNSLGGKI